MSNITSNQVLNKTTKEQKIIRRKASFRRGFTQIRDTISFELLKNKRKFIYQLIFVTSIWVLYLGISEFTIAFLDSAIPEDPINYIESYLSLIGIMLLVIATAFGSSIIAEDYSKKTANLLFPKITKGRLLAGRFLADSFLAIGTVIFYYFLIGLITFIKYNTIPSILLYSIFWAAIYTIMLLAFVTFLSSWMNSSSAVTVTSLLFTMMVTMLIRNLLMVTGVTIEPFFIFTYYGDIIVASLAMPVNRFVEMTAHGPGVSGELYYQWITPAAADALLGIIIFTVIFLSSAYLLFKRRKNNQ